MIIRRFAERLAKKPETTTSKVKVAFFNHIGHEMGGAERTLFTTLRYRPSVIDARAILLEDGKFAAELRSIGVGVHIEPAPVSATRFRRGDFRFFALLPTPMIALRIARYLRSERIEVLYTNSMKAHFIGALAGKIAGIPCVMHFHDHIDGWGLAMLRTAAFLGSRERIACSRNVQCHIGLGRTTVIYSPIEAQDPGAASNRSAARQALGVHEDLPTIALIGRINRWKGHDRFVRIAGLVNSRRPVQFLIVGSPIFRDEDFLPELVTMVRASKLDKLVRFIPWLEDLHNVYGATDVVVNCSTREPLGRTPAEAAAAGIPSVVFDDSGAAEWLCRNAYSRIVPAGDERAMAAAILALIENPDPNRAKAMQELARIFEPRRVAEKIAEIAGRNARLRRNPR